MRELALNITSISLAVLAVAIVIGLLVIFDGRL